MVVVIVETAVVVVSFEDSTGEVVVEVAVVEDKSMVEKSCGWSACRCSSSSCGSSSNFRREHL